MTVRINKPVQGGTIRAIISKSDVHRLLICAALSDKEAFIYCPQRSEDIEATERCLVALGAGLRHGLDNIFVNPIPHSPAPIPPITMDCGESGSTLRFLLPVCAALGINASFIMKGRLGERPISPLLNELAAKGCTILEHSSERITISGQLLNGEYTLPGDISSQFISGLLLALPLLDGESIIRTSGHIESRPYIDMTLGVLMIFGINIIEEDGNVFRIPGRKAGKTMGELNEGKSPLIIKPSGDWSNAAFWLAAGAIGKDEITCTGIFAGSKQGDWAIIGILQSFGAFVTCENGKVNVTSSKLRGINIDVKDTPDLVPVIAALASVAEGKTVIRNAKRLRLKESDRLKTTALSLSNLGADIIETDDGLIIEGKKELAGGETPSYGDHRIAMAAAILSSVCIEPVVIKDAEAVNKSYPDFFKDFQSLGGVCEIT